MPVKSAVLLLSQFCENICVKLNVGVLCYFQILHNREMPSILSAEASQQTLEPVRKRYDDWMKKPRW